jgi:hypothetical protein
MASQSGAGREASAERELLTAERQSEIQHRIDRRFDQFSLDEVRDADSGALTFGLAFPGLSIFEREFSEKYFNQKVEELRRRLQGDPKPSVPKGE